MIYKAISIGALGVGSFLAGYFYCKHQLENIICDAIETLDKTKVVMVKADKLVKDIEYEVHNTPETDNKEELPKDNL